jgi:hypothetical protein
MAHSYKTITELTMAFIQRQMKFAEENHANVLTYRAFAIGAQLLWEDLTVSENDADAKADYRTMNEMIEQIGGRRDAE